MAWISWGNHHFWVFRDDLAEEGKEVSDEVGVDFRSSSTEIWRRWWWRSSGWLCRCSPEERHRATWRETKTHPIFKVHLFLLISSISEVLDFRYFKHIFLNYYFCDFWFSPSLLWTSDFELRIFQVSLRCPTLDRIATKEDALRKRGMRRIRKGWTWMTESP